MPVPMRWKYVQVPLVNKRNTACDQCGLNVASFKFRIYFYGLEDPDHNEKHCDQCKIFNENLRAAGVQLVWVPRP